MGTVSKASEGRRAKSEQKTDYLASTRVERGVDGRVRLLRPKRRYLTPASAAAPGAPVPDLRAFRHVVPSLHNPESGRLDARQIAAHFGLELKTVAGLLGQKLSTISKTPDSKALQPDLTVFGRIAAALQRLVGSEQNSRIWLNAPNPQLGGKTPAQAIAEGDADIVAGILDDMLVGQPA